MLALSGSTNSVVHLIAMARRSGFNLDLDRFDHLARTTPVLANLRPAGKYLMEDFYYAGGLRAMLVQLGDLLDTTQRTVDGRTLGENIAGARIFNEDVIRPRAQALIERDGLAVLRGNLAPDGAVIKPPAMEERLQVHTGRAVVFKDYNDMAARIDDPDLDVDADSVIVLQNAGPQGAPGMPEWGQLPIPQKLLEAGRARHGADLGCPHERHQLRRLCAARGARSLRRRPAGAGAGRRPHRAGRARTAAGTADPGSRAGRAPRRMAGAAAALRARLRRALPEAHRPGGHGLRLRFSPDRNARCGRGRA